MLLLLLLFYEHGSVFFFFCCCCCFLLVLLAIGAKKHSRALKYGKHTHTNKDTKRQLFGLFLAFFFFFFGKQGILKSAPPPLKKKRRKEEGLDYNIIIKISSFVNKLGCRTHKLTSVFQRIREKKNNSLIGKSNFSNSAVFLLLVKSAVLYCCCCCCCLSVCVCVCTLPFFFFFFISSYMCVYLRI